MNKRTTSKCPPLITFSSLQELYSVYRNQMVDNPAEDPSGHRVWFFVKNFPKLIQLEGRNRKSGRFEKVKARKIIGQIKKGKAENYCRCDMSRAQTVTWIPEVIEDPDSIHENNYKKIEGEDVYVRRYNKTGPPFKLVFTVVDEQSGKRVVTTSFWVKEGRLKKFIKLPPKYERK